MKARGDGERKTVALGQALCSIIEGQWSWYGYRGISRSNKTMPTPHPETDEREKTGGKKDRRKH